MYLITLMKQSQMQSLFQAPLAQKKQAYAKSMLCYVIRNLAATK